MMLTHTSFANVEYEVEPVSTGSLWVLKYHLSHKTETSSAMQFPISGRWDVKMLASYLLT